MTYIVANFTNQGVPLEAPATIPTIRIRRLDTGALVVTDATMTEVGDGLFVYDFSADPSLGYAIRADGDPLGAGQTTQSERYQWGELLDLDTLRLRELWQRMHLDTANPRVDSLDAIKVPADGSIIDIELVRSGSEITGTRQP